MADEEDDVPGVPEWVVTYGDMMSLLLTFFIMLVSLSEMKSDNGKLRAALDAISEAFGATDGSAGVPGPSLETTSVLNKRHSQGSRSEGGMDRAGRISPGTSGPHTSVERVNHGAVITLGGPAVFPRESVSLNAQLQPKLDVISKELAHRPNLVVVRGHTAREPVSPQALQETQESLGFSEFDKLDMAFARALAVAERMVDKGITADRLRVESAADSEPRSPSRLKSHRERNHRVDVFAIDSYIPPPKSSRQPN